ncbi:hypothetical protein PPL_05196 [Heterostelium album PN500]|uniref:IPT/TIG domain-containing protein n=1 Tax=Heterostelium pallidum (strain ATCC 26659 / Pp 5 / PN500) TaxID=670386 RepID=D3B9Q0_HETP5|nr:hypothetical protein PPL_05196 [Heterostelium album PN500]EFA81962.1 hypothetical protein PPL_05196 [Heterostelium album PN500]|eukprot:XP_020434079.1 hypothetical protein PPL_05196 [Heterostelium album PN500]
MTTSRDFCFRKCDDHQNFMIIIKFTIISLILLSLISLSSGTLTFKYLPAKIPKNAGFKFYEIDASFDVTAYNSPTQLKVQSLQPTGQKRMTCFSLGKSQSNAIYKLHAECQLTYVGDYIIELTGVTDKAKYTLDLSNLIFPNQIIPGTSVTFSADMVDGVNVFALTDNVNPAMNIVPTRLNAQTMEVAIPPGLTSGLYSYYFVGNAGKLLPTQIFTVDVFQPFVNSAEVVDYVPFPTIRISGNGLDNNNVPPVITINGDNCLVFGVISTTSITCKTNIIVPGVYPIEIDLTTYPAPSNIHNIDINYHASINANRVFPSLLGGEMIVYTREVANGQIPNFHFDYNPAALLARTGGYVNIDGLQYAEIRVSIPANTPGQFNIMMSWVTGANPPIAIPDTTIAITYLATPPQLQTISPPMARFTPSFTNFNTNPIRTQITIGGTNFVDSIAPTVQLTGVNPTTGNLFTIACEDIRVQTNIFCTVKSPFEIEYSVQVSYSPQLVSNTINIRFYGLSCLGRTQQLPSVLPNPPVDWSFTFKFRETEDTPDYEKDSYLYLDNQYDTAAVQRLQGLTDTTTELSPLAATFDQIQYGYSYYFYNDQVGMRKPDGHKVKDTEDPLANFHIYSKGTNWGHTKGMVIYDHDTGSGLHIIHSQPYWPAFTFNGATLPTKKVPGPPPYEYYGIDTPNWLGDKSLNQHFFCYTFGPHDNANPDTTGINFVSKFISQNNPMLFQSVYHGLPNIYKQLDILLNPDHLAIRAIVDNCKAVVTAKGNLKDNCWWKYNFRTKGGNLLDLFAKTSNKYEEQMVPQVSASATALRIRNTNSHFMLDGIDIYEKMLDVFNDLPPPRVRPFFVQTLELGVGKRAYQTLDRQKLLSNVEYTLHSTDIMENLRSIQHRADRDHSKLMYNMQAQPFSTLRYDNIFCAGDSNRHNGQGIRGGGAACIFSPVLVNYFSNRVARYSNVVPINVGANLFGIQSMDLPVWMINSIIQVRIKPTDILIAVPSGSVFEVFQTVTYDKGVTHHAIPTIPRTYGTTDITSQFETEMFIYRSDINEKAEWTETWSFSITANKPNPIHIQQLYALQTAQFSVFACNRIVSPCDIESSYRVDTAFDLATNPFQYLYHPVIEFVTHANFMIPSNNPMPFINHFIEYLIANCLNWLAVSPTYEIVVTTPGTESRVENGQLHIHNIQCQEEIAFVLTWKSILLLIQQRDNTVTVDNNIIKGISWAISKHLINLMRGSINSNIDVCFSLNPERKTPVDLEGMPNNIDPPSAYWYAATVWDWLDTQDDQKLGPVNGVSSDTHEDKNQGREIPWQTILDQAMHAQTIVNIYKNLPMANQVKENADIILYNGFDPALITASSRNRLMSSTANPQSYYYNMLEQTLVEPGYFTSYQLTSLSPIQLEELYSSIFSKWETNQAIQILLENPLNSIVANHLIQNLDLLYNDISFGSIKLCYLTGETKKLCDPMSMVSMIHLIETITSSGEPLNSLSSDSNYDSDLQVYFIDAVAPTLSNLYSGMVIANLRGQLCDVSFTTLPKSNVIEIIDSICLISGPIIQSVSISSGPTSGNYPMDIQGYHFTSGMIASVGSNNCIQSTFIDSTKIQCMVPSGYGNNQPITLYNPSNDQFDSQTLSFSFTYNLPVIHSVTPFILPSSGTILTINGENFGNTKSLINLKAKGISDSLTILSLSDLMITCQIPSGSGAGFFISLAINRYNVPSLNGNGLGLNMVSYQNPIINSFTPVIGKVFDILRIEGSSFGQDLYRSKVFIGFKECPILSLSESIINCRIPYGISNELITVQIARHKPIFSNKYFQYQSSAITSQASQISTRGGLIQFHGDSFGSSLNDIASTKFDSQPVDCVPFNLFIECQIPEGIKNNLEFEIATNIYDNTTIVNVYLPPVIESMAFSFQTNNIIIFGKNFIPNQIPYDISTSYIEFLDQQSQPIRFNQTFIDENQISVGLNVLELHLISVQVVVEGRASNLMNLQFDFNTFIEIYQDNNMDGLQQQDEPTVSGTVLLSGISNPYDITPTSGTFTIPAGSYLMSIQVTPDLVLPLNNYNIEISATDVNVIKIPVWSKKNCVQSYPSTNGQTIVTLQQGTTNLWVYDICVNTLDCKYPVTSLSPQPSQCVATSLSNIAIIEIGSPITLLFYFDNNLNGVKDASEDEPTPGTITILYSTKNGRQLSTVAQTNPVQFLSYKGAVTVSLVFSNPNVYSILNKKVYYISDPLSDTYGLYRWSYDSIKPVILYNSYGVELSLPIGKYNLSTLSNMGFVGTKNHYGSGIINSLNTFTTDIRVTFTKTELSTPVLQLSAPTRTNINQMSLVLIEVSYIPLFSAFNGVEPSGQQIQFFSPYISAVPNFFYGGPSYTNPLNCNASLTDQTLVTCTVPAGSGSVPLSMMMNQMRLFAFKEYKMVYSVILVRGVVFEDLNGNNIRDSGEIILSNVKVVLGLTTTATTNAMGSYTFSGLYSGSFVLSVPPSSTHYLLKPISVNLSPSTPGLIQHIGLTKKNLDNINNDASLIELKQSVVTITIYLDDQQTYSTITKTGSTSYTIDITPMVTFQFSSVGNIRPVINNPTMLSATQPQFYWPYYQYLNGAPSQIFYDQPTYSGATLELPVGVYNSNYLAGLPISWSNSVKSFTTAPNMVVVLLTSVTRFEARDNQAVVVAINPTQIEILADNLLVDNLIVPTIGGSFFINNWSSKTPQASSPCGGSSACTLLPDGSKYQCPVIAGITKCSITIKFDNFVVSEPYTLSRAAASATGFVLQPSRLPANELIINGQNFPPANIALGYSKILVDGNPCQLVSFINETRASCLAAAITPLTDDGVLTFIIGNLPPSYYNFQYKSSKCNGATIKAGTQTKNYAIGANLTPAFAYNEINCSWFCYCTSTSNPVNAIWTVGINSMVYSKTQTFTKDKLKFSVQYAKCNGLTISDDTNSDVTLIKGDYTFAANIKLKSIVKPQIGCKVLMSLDATTNITVVSSFDPANFPNYPRWSTNYLSKAVIADYPDLRGTPLSSDGQYVSSPPLLNLSVGNVKSL